VEKGWANNLYRAKDEKGLIGASILLETPRKFAFSLSRSKRAKPNKQVPASESIKSNGPSLVND
jgi:hypothetical protein